MLSRSYSIKNVFLYSLIVSVCLSAFLGIIAILSGDFGELQIKVILTSLTISGASLGGLCCGAAYEARRVPFFALAGILLVGVTALMLLFGIWTEVRWDAYWQMVGTMSAFATAFAHLSLLQMARLTRLYQTAIWFGYVVDFAMCGLISYLIWWDYGFDEDWMFRLIGVDAILIAAVSILIPILHRLSRGEVDITDGDIEATLADIDYEMSSLKQRLQELEAQKIRLLEQV
ncbi:MAG: hypothetical protein HUJ26_08365 [Planctomycetaceae bacterium]|nr:hypothetical protein [Planctomycetaceae bacterium]